MNADCGRLSRGNPDFDRHLCDGFVLGQVSEDAAIVFDRHLGRDSFDPTMDDSSDDVYVVEDE